MAKKRRYTADYILLIVLAAVVALLLSYMLKRYHLNDEAAFEPDLSAAANPMMGYAPYAENVKACSDTELVFIKLKWSDWEPEMGQYDTAYLESNYHLARWRAAGKHAVLRFICDEPGEEGHADLPQWLLDETADGSWYTSDYGCGYSPNYENPYFIERHAAAIAALADYFNQDDFLAYVEFGSLGFWGEWHARNSEGYSMMPSAQTCWDYILHYSERFQNVRFLMRRSYVQAVDAGLGLYNDMLGDAEQTERWLEWTVSGGSQDTVGESLPILPYEAFWETAPVGGEPTSGIEPDTLFRKELSTMLKQVETSHMTFVGPYCPDADTYGPAYEAIQRRLGYKYYVSRLSTAFSFADDALVLQLDWENAGIAPLYWDWPVTIRIFDAQNNPVYSEALDLRLSQLLPGETFTTTTSIPYLDSLRDGLSVGIRITSYDGNDQVRLAMDTEWLDDWQILYGYRQE